MADIPKQYKACVYDTPAKISTKIETLDIPESGPGECLIKLTHSGVCHSDFGVMTNSVPTFQQYCIGPLNYVTPISDTLKSADAAPILCAA